MWLLVFVLCAVIAAYSMVVELYDLVDRPDDD